MHKVHTQKLSKTERRAMWDAILQDFFASGQSLKNYTDTHGLKYDLFCYYVNAYKRKQASTPASPFIALDMPSPPSASSTAEPISQPDAAIRIEMGKLTLQVPLTISATMLNTIITGLISV